MITTELIQTLKTEAIAKGLCKPWQEKFVKNLNIIELIDMYVRGIDFCINNNYPSLDFLRKKFKGLTEPYGVFIDEKNLFLSNSKTVVLNGNCRAILNYDGYSVSSLYVRHDSRAHITISDNAILVIDAFDNSHLSISAYDTSRAIIHTRGKAAVEIIKNDPQANIKIKKTNTNTY